MSIDRLYDDPELAQFYDLENGWSTDCDYCLRLAEGARSVLDLGCGTGLLTVALAEGRPVTGVDPAAAMLDVARRRPGGDRVTWLEADARALRLDRRFDLVLLTGHAFQVFLSADDRQAVLRTIARHLEPGGRFIFDTRNPATVGWRDWTPEQSARIVQHPRLGAVLAWNDVAYDAATGIVTYETHYEPAQGGGRFSAASRIRFTPREEVAAGLEAAGLHVEEWLGNWSGDPWSPTAPEIIPLGRLR